MPNPRDLRRRETNAERELWRQLRNRGLAGLKFRRQVAVDRCVVDFLCESAHLIVEVDGGQHAIKSADDERRDRRLSECGYLVLRFWNNDVLRNTEGVLSTILASIDREVTSEAS